MFRFRFFRKVPRFAQSPVHFVGRNVMETAFFISGFDLGRTVHPMATCGFQTRRIGKDYAGND